MRLSIRLHVVCRACAWKQVSDRFLIVILTRAVLVAVAAHPGVFHGIMGKMTVWLNVYLGAVETS